MGIMTDIQAEGTCTAPNENKIEPESKSSLKYLHAAGVSRARIRAANKWVSEETKLACFFGKRLVKISMAKWLPSDTATQAPRSPAQSTRCLKKVSAHRRLPEKKRRRIT